MIMEANNYDDFHTIFMIRDIKTWLSKEQIQKMVYKYRYSNSQL